LVSAMRVNSGTGVVSLSLHERSSSAPTSRMSNHCPQPVAFHEMISFGLSDAVRILYGASFVSLQLPLSPMWFFARGIKFPNVAAVLGTVGTQSCWQVNCLKPPPMR
jgi:hypothetical protein